MSDSKDSKVEQKPLYVAVDIESAGSSYDHAVLQIGVAWSFDGEKFETKSFCSEEAFNLTGFETRCWEEFWTKNTKVLQRIQNEAIEDEFMWLSFVEFWNAFDSKSKTVKVVSDNPTFDLGRIDHALSKLKRLPLRYTQDGKYRSVDDPSEKIKGLPKSKREEIKAILEKTTPHTHWAPDDATHILKMNFLVDKYIKEVQDLA